MGRGNSTLLEATIATARKSSPAAAQKKLFRNLNELSCDLDTYDRDLIFAALLGSQDDYNLLQETMASYTANEGSPKYSQEIAKHFSTRQELIVALPALQLPSGKESTSPTVSRLDALATAAQKRSLFGKIEKLYASFDTADRARVEDILLGDMDSYEEFNELIAETAAENGNEAFGRAVANDFEKLKALIAALPPLDA